MNGRCNGQTPLVNEGGRGGSGDTRATIVSQEGQKLKKKKKKKHGEQVSVGWGCGCGCGGMGMLPQASAVHLLVFQFQFSCRHTVNALQLGVYLASGLKSRAIIKIK